MFLAAVPAYEEENKIASVVEDLKKEVDEVVVVNDGSDDNTKKKAKQAGATVITHEINRGQGAAIETARKYALQKGADYLLIFDGDGQFSTDDVSAAFRKIKEENLDIVFGSRFLDKKSDIPFLKKNFLLPIAHIVDYIFTGLKLTDVHNGFKIFADKAIKQIEIKQDKMAHASEIPKKVKQLDLDYGEVSVNVLYDDYGQNFLSGTVVIKDLLFGKFVK